MNIRISLSSRSIMVLLALMVAAVYVFFNPNWDHTVSTFVDGVHDSAMEQQAQWSTVGE